MHLGHHLVKNNTEFKKMIAEEILKSEGIYFGFESIEEIPCSIGYIKEFRWSWIATQLNTFIFIGESNTSIDKRLIEAFSMSCYKYALKNNKGWPRGLQAGIGSIAILKGERIENSAVEFCESLSKKHWSAFEIPVAYNTLEKKVIKYKSSPVWGRIFFPYLSNLIDNLIKKI
jgi:hypothetical protein